MKLALGSNRIIGIPNSSKSYCGSKSRDIVLPHATAAIRNVTDDVTTEYLKALLKIASTLDEETVALFTTYQPTKKPKRMQKRGTPIPIPKKMTSRSTKTRKARLGLIEKARSTRDTGRVSPPSAEIPLFRSSSPFQNDIPVHASGQLHRNVESYNTKKSNSKSRETAEEESV